MSVRNAAIALQERKSLQILLCKRLGAYTCARTVVYSPSASCTQHG